MDISEKGLALITRFEGYSYHAYFDRWGGVWTVGFGETENVHSGTTMTRAQAEHDLQARIIKEYEPSIKALKVDLNQNQFDALCSFVWNLGVGSMAWDVGRYCRGKKWTLAANSMLEYTHAGGVVLPGLVTRRRAERALFLTPWHAPAPPDPHNYDWYPTGPFGFARKDGSKFNLNERGSVIQYDSLWEAKPQDKKAIATVRGHIKILRDRIWVIAHQPPNPPNWSDSRRLGWRWQRLNERLAGKVRL